MTHADRMTVAEVAELLDVCPQSVYDAAGRREIPHIRIGRRIVFPRAAVMEWFHSAGRVSSLPVTKAG